MCIYKPADPQTSALAAGYDVTVWMDNEPGTIEPQRKLTEPKDEEL